ncbi:MAG: DUF302 domain-containing protein [Epsilonproteobacteria bacterium]|nr:DUF302 domain-containing protein [Campylobacterota bacterium]
MKKLFLSVVMVLSLQANDIIVKKSHCDVKQTVQNLKEVITTKGLHIFAIINHSGNAKAVGMQMEPTIMIVFGKAELGTKLMQQDPLVGLDLPLRVLVYKDKDGETKMAYRDGSWLKNKHIINAPKIIQKINQGMDTITTQAGICTK